MPKLNHEDQLAKAHRLNERLVDHPVGSTALAFIPMLLILQFLIFIKPPTGATNVVAWIGLASCLYTPAIVVTVPRFTKQSQEHSVWLRWSLAYSPFLFGFVSVMSKGAEWPLGPGFLVTGALLIFSMVTARRERDRRPTSGSSTLN
jgi:hypothetical protein